MTSGQITMLITMAVYLIAMVGIGFKLTEKNETVGDFFLGGRQLGPLVTAMSAEASDMSSYLLMGLPGLAYLSGTAEVGWTVIGLAVGTYLNWLIVAKRLRRYTERIGSITIPEFFSNRWGDRHNLLTAIAAVWIIVFFVPYTASGFAACGKLFRSLFGIDYHTAMIVSAVVIIFYTALGGFLAASLTDFIQSIIMSLALLAILLFGVFQAGGFEMVMENARSLPGYLSFTQTYDPVTRTSSAYDLLEICSTLAWGLGYFGMPHILLRFMAIENEEKLGLSRRVASVWVVISMAIAVLIGMSGLGMSVRGVVPVLEGSASETIIVEVANLLSTYGIPAALLAGVVLSGILASTMSTADSQLLAASSSVSNDLLVNVLHLNIKKEQNLLVSRLSLVLIAVIGIVLAWNPESSVFGIVSFAWAGFGASFGPLVLLALFWRRSNKYGALAGMVTGGVMVFVWKFAVRPRGGILGIYELLPAFVLAILVNVLVTLVTPQPEKEILDCYDSLQKRSGQKD